MHTRNTYEENLCILHRQGRFIAAYNRAEMPECIFMKQEYRAENKKKKQSNEERKDERVEIHSYTYNDNRQQQQQQQNNQQILQSSSITRT